MLSLLYVSCCTVPASQWPAALIDIHSVSIANNSAHDITGLLIATPDWFAQLLEGPPENVDRAMMSILADPRHLDVRIVRREMIGQRRDPLWRLARFDRGAFEATHVGPAIECAHANRGDVPLRALDRLIDKILTGCHHYTLPRVC